MVKHWPIWDHRLTKLVLKQCRAFCISTFAAYSHLKFVCQTVFHHKSPNLHCCFGHIKNLLFQTSISWNKLQDKPITYTYNCHNETCYSSFWYTGTVIAGPLELGTHRACGMCAIYWYTLNFVVEIYFVHNELQEVH